MAGALARPLQARPTHTTGACCHPHPHTASPRDERALLACCWPAARLGRIASRPHARIGKAAPSPSPGNRPRRGHEGPRTEPPPPLDTGRAKAAPMVIGAADAPPSISAIFPATPDLRQK